MRVSAVALCVALGALALGMPACDDGGDGGPDVVDVVAETVEETESCVPDCKDRECGDNGCGGFCGACDEGFSCTAQGQCQELPKCELVQLIGCDETIEGDTSGRANELEQYECKGFEGLGPDIVYVFQAKQDDLVWFTLDSVFGNQDVMVTQSPCRPDTCLAWSDDKAELSVEGGKKYYVVVDAQENQQGPFTLTVGCNSTCAPQCLGKECGDDGCGGSCGECPGAAPFCADGVCQVECTPDCTGKACGDDGCGGSCGVCGALQECVDGACVGDCEPDCTGKECGDDGCGGECGQCGAGEMCDAGACVAGAPGCVQSDEPGCGGCTCEACVCAMDSYCCDSAWDSLCVDECVDECGGCEPVVGCGDGECVAAEDEDCATCPADCGCGGGAVCVDGACCELQCDGKECGDDGCGGQCGSCGDGLCLDGTCFPAGAYCLSVLPESVDLGVLKVNSFATEDLLVKNCGSETLLVTSIDLAPGAPGDMGLDLSGLDHEPSVAEPLAIVAGDSVLVPLLYLPSEASPKVDGEWQPVTAEVVVQAGPADLEQAVPVTAVVTDDSCPTAAIVVEEGAEVIPQTVLHLKGDQSSSPGAQIQDWSWSVEQPVGSMSTFNPSATFPNPTFEANVAGTYVFELTVKDANGIESCVPATYEVVVIPDEAIHVELVWHTPGDPDETDSGPEAGADLDLHFLHPWASGPDLDGDGAPDGWFDTPYDCFWFNPQPNWGAFDPGVDDDPGLDRDDTDGVGPENLNLNLPEDVTYRVGVHYWNDHGYGNSLATVRVYVYADLVWEMKDIELVHLDMWEVCTVDWTTGDVLPVTDDEGGVKITSQYENPFFFQ